MPASLPQALEAEVKRQGVPADQIQKLELDQKCRAAAIQGLERFTNLVHLSLGSVNLTSLANFPQLPKLQNLLLSDNKIAGGLEALTAAKLDQLTELDLSNNKFASLPSFKPLAGLRSLKALHVEANPAERTVKDLRQALFKMMAALQYVDNADPFGKERPTFEEEDDAEDVYEEEEEVDADDDDGEDAEGEDVDDDEDDAGDEGETFEEEGEGGGAGGAPQQGGGFGDEEDDEDDDEEDGEEDEEVDEFEEEDDEDEEEEPTLGTAYLVGAIPPDVEDDEEEYEDEEDAASEDFDEEEDEEPVGGSVAAALQSMKRKRDEEDDEEEDEEEEEEYDDEDE